MQFHFCTLYKCPVNSWIVYPYCSASTIASVIKYHRYSILIHCWWCAWWDVTSCCVQMHCLRDVDVPSSINKQCTSDACYALQWNLAAHPFAHTSIFFIPWRFHSVEGQWRWPSYIIFWLLWSDASVSASCVVLFFMLQAHPDGIQPHHFRSRFIIGIRIHLHVDCSW